MRSGRCGTAAARTRTTLLASCYRDRARSRGREHSLASIAFPAISTGIYAFPADRAARIAVGTVASELSAAPRSLSARGVLLFLGAVAAQHHARCGEAISGLAIAGLPVGLSTRAAPASTFALGNERTSREEERMAKSQKVIITCAVTGSIHTPSMSPHIPITASEIADAAIGAAEAGAAIVHLHARDPKDGRPDQSPEAFAPFLKVIKQRCKAVINITTGGAPTMSIEERVQPGRDVQAGSRLAQHGLDEFRPLPDAPALQGQVQARLGGAVSRRLARAHLQEHLRGHRIHPDAPAPRTARASRSSATTSGISTRCSTSSSAAS